MKTLLHSFLFILLVAGPAQAAPLGSSIRYNGHLRENGAAANGGYDIKFSLWDSATAGTQVGPTVTLAGVMVEDGVLSASPDFGDVFDGNAYWLELEVRKGNSGNFTALSPRQSLDAAPYALHAPRSGVADSAKGVGQNAVHSGGIQNGAVTGDKITSKGVGNGHLDDGTVDGRVLQNGVVTGGKLAPNAITADKIAASHVVKSLNALKDDVTLAAGSGITLTPAGNTISISAIPAAPGWSLNGNAGTTPRFLGTTDNGELQLKVNNVTAMRYQPTGTQVPNILGGFGGNYTTLSAVGVTIAGGGGSSPNAATDNYTTVGGGIGNEAGTDNLTPHDGFGATVGGGQLNKAAAGLATVAGGEFNEVSSDYGAIGGGRNNQIAGEAAVVPNGPSPSTIAGGDGNIIDTGFGAIGGGQSNYLLSGAEYGTIPGGFSNRVAGPFGLAAGYRARAAHKGAFVWADSSQREFASTDDDEFSVRATGGARFVSGYPAPGDNTVVGVQLSPGAGSWSSLSDRNTKTNVQPVAARAVLEHLARLPISTWNYRSQKASVRHIGPMAQDFAAAFQVGEDNTHISTVDADGVALAAIQGLYEMLRERDASIIRLEKRLAELEKRVADGPAGSDERGTP